MHLQPASKKIDAHKVYLPNTEDICSRVFSLPVHEFVTKQELKKMINLINNYFND